MKKYTLRCAARNAEDFTAVDFGWVNYLAPGGATIGMQPDMYEYIYCKALAWDAPVSLVGNLEELRRHPRTEDNLRVMERWERAKLADVFTPEQKERLKDPDREFFLFEDSQDASSSIPAGSLRPTTSRACGPFFRRGTKSCILYWHTSGEDQLRLTLPASRPTLTDDRGGASPSAAKDDSACCLPPDGPFSNWIFLRRRLNGLFLGAVRKINRPIEPQKMTIRMKHCLLLASLFLTAASGAAEPPDRKTRVEERPRGARLLRRQDLPVRILSLRRCGDAACRGECDPSPGVWSIGA